MKKSMVFFLMLLSFTVFAGLSVIPDATQVYIGSEVNIKITLSDDSGNPIAGNVNVDFNVGGFENPEIIFEGINVDGEANVKYLAPLVEGSETISFSYAEEIFKVTLYFVKPQEEELETATAKIKDFSGTVAFKKANSDIWEALTMDTILSEGDELLTMQNSYVEIQFPDGSISKILENSQVLFKELKFANGKVAISIELKKGDTYNVVEKFLVSGSKFEIKTGSVTAGVRGTRFAVVNREGEAKIMTYEGKVFAYFADGKILPVPAGYSIGPVFAPPAPVEVPEEKFIKTKPEVEKPPVEEPEKKPEEIPEKVTQPQAPAQPVAAIPPMSIGPVNKDGQNYFVYSIAPEFNIGPVSLGIGFTAYATEVGGELYFGQPSSTPSTNIINAFTLNSIGLNIGPMAFRYGNMAPMSLGMGFTMRDYYKPTARAFDLQLSLGEINFYVHVPYELTKIYPLEFVQSDSVYFGEVVLNFALPLIGETELGLGVVYDMEASNVYTLNSATPVELAAILSLRKPVFGDFRLGVEVSVETGEELTTFGGFAGLYGKLWVANVTAGVYYTMDGFVPYIFNRNYSTNKLNNTLQGMDNPGGAGYLVGFDFETSYAAGRFYLSGLLSSESSPTLEGEARAIVPQIGAFSGLFITAYYYDETPFGEFLSPDTICTVKITYPLLGENLTGGIIFEWTGTEWQKGVIIGADIWR
ncbi:FecR domain-containing protein [Thermosipho ferrireducens]|uniref:FecR domain-containing protein n=1 Tax=Thermosipho ferrireducens TaxID=2571116 RepID=A0ABX7SA97_9BACT|nr:FecR family protein [Thermosipho ferrireducens]QTA38190.1 FecR domain-containing protein [Thermosipho ferrireducens]